MKSYVCSIICVLLILLCACQPTPENEYIVNKGDDIAGDKIRATAVPVHDKDDPQNSEEITQPDFPARWEDDIKTENGEMVIDADVIVPDIDRYPVHIVKRHTFSDVEIRRIMDYFFPEVVSWAKGESMCREDYERALAKLMANENIPEDTKKEQLEYVKAEMASCTLSESDCVPAEHIEEIEGPIAGEYVLRRADGTCGQFLNNGSSLLACTYSNSHPHKKSVVESEEGAYMGEKDGKVNSPITVDEAMTIADSFFEKTGIDGFALAESEEARLFEHYPLAVLNMGWYFQFVRTFDYTPVNPQRYSRPGFNFEGEDYNQMWMYEILDMYVGEDGVQYIEWRDPMEDAGVVNENVELLDFESLSEIVKRQFKAWVNFNEPRVGYYKVDEVILSAAPQYIKDSKDAYMIPTWIFKIGKYISVKDFWSSHRLPGGEELQGYFYVAFNAIDGTRVELKASPNS